MTDLLEAGKLLGSVDKGIDWKPVPFAMFPGCMEAGNMSFEKIE